MALKSCQSLWMPLPTSPFGLFLHPSHLLSFSFSFDMGSPYLVHASLEFSILLP